MLQLELPHVNVLTKMDLLKEKRTQVERCVVRRRGHTDGTVGFAARKVTDTWEFGTNSFLHPDATLFAHELQDAMHGRYRRLNAAVAALVRTRCSRVSRLHARRCDAHTLVID